jgi:hypothetical protein
LTRPVHHDRHPASTEARAVSTNESYSSRMPGFPWLRSQRATTKFLHSGTFGGFTGQAQ